MNCIFLNINEIVGLKGFSQILPILSSFDVRKVQLCNKQIKKEQDMRNLTV